MEFEDEHQWTEEGDNEVNQESEQFVEEEENNVEEITEKLSPPEVNKIFNSEDEVYEYYRQYGLQNGFGITKRNTRKIEGISTYLTFACHRYGDPHRKVVDSLNPKPVVKSNCKARLCAKRMEDDKWLVTQFDNDHNHDLSPSKAYRFRCNRKLTNHAKRSLNLYDEAGIPMNKSFNTLVVEHGGHENMSFNKKDCENYMRTIRRLRLAEGDVVALQNYFNKAQLVDSNFYYSIDLDDENRIKNLFWADARCRAAYKEFGDVVTFDTTYLTNKYDMPVEEALNFILMHDIYIDLNVPVEEALNFISHEGAIGVPERLEQ